MAQKPIKQALNLTPFGASQIFLSAYLLVAA